MSASLLLPEEPLDVDELLELEDPVDVEVSLPLEEPLAALAVVLVLEPVLALATEVVLAVLPVLLAPPDELEDPKPLEELAALGLRLGVPMLVVT